MKYRFVRSPVSILFLSIVSSRRLQDMSSKHLEDKSSRRLQDGFSVTFFRLLRRLQHVLQDVFKTSSRRLGRRKIVTLKMCWRRLRDMSWRRLENVFKSNKCLLGRYKSATWKWAWSSNFYKWFAAKSAKIQVFTYLLKNVPLIVNDGKPKRKVENEVSP